MVYHKIPKYCHGICVIEIYSVRFGYAHCNLIGVQWCALRPCQYLSISHLYSGFDCLWSSIGTRNKKRMSCRDWYKKRTNGSTWWIALGQICVVPTIQSYHKDQLCYRICMHNLFSLFNCQLHFFRFLLHLNIGPSLIISLFLNLPLFNLPFLHCYMDRS